MRFRNRARRAASEHAEPERADIVAGANAEHPEEIVLLTIGLAAMCLGVAIGILCTALPRTSAPVPFTTYVQFAAMAGIFAMGSTVMYLVHAYGGGKPALVVADATMVMAPGFMLVAVAALTDRKRGVVVGVVSAAATAVGGCTAVLSDDVSLAIKAAVLAMICASCALVAGLSSTLDRLPALLLAAAMGAYALYTAARVLVAVTTGWSGAVGALFRSMEVGSAVAMVIVLVCGAAVILSLRPSARATATGPRELGVVVVGDAKLLAAASGGERLRRLVAELRAAAHALDDRAVNVRHGVATSLPSALDTLTDQMQNSFGWAPEEVALLVEDGDPSASPGTA